MVEALGKIEVINPETGAAVKTFFCYSKPITDDNSVSWLGENKTWHTLHFRNQLVLVSVFNK